VTISGDGGNRTRVREARPRTFYRFILSCFFLAPESPGRQGNSETSRCGFRPSVTAPDGLSCQKMTPSKSRGKQRNLRTGCLKFRQPVRTNSRRHLNFSERITRSSDPRPAYPSSLNPVETFSSPTGMVAHAELPDDSGQAAKLAKKLESLKVTKFESPPFDSRPHSRGEIGYYNIIRNRCFCKRN